MLASTSSGFRRPLYFVYFARMSAMSAAYCRSEFARSPKPRVFIDVVVGPSVGVPRQIQKILGRQFVSFEVTDIDDPDAIGAVLFGETHLIPDLCDRARVHPLIAARAAVVIEVIVDSRAAGTFPFFRGWQPAHVAPVVFRPEQRHVVGHAQALSRNSPGPLYIEPKPAAPASTFGLTTAAMILRCTSTMCCSSEMLSAWPCTIAVSFSPRNPMV